MATGGLMRLVNTSPSRSLNYQSLQADEEARFAHPRTIPRTDRNEPNYPPNGNLRLIIPDIDKPEVRNALSPSRRVNTSTRTVFNNDKVYDTNDTIADKVASPTFRSNALKLSGHVTMDTMAPTDPRQQHMPPRTPAELGPGCYPGIDPCGLHTTGSPGPWEPHQSHHTAPLSKDPTRPSPAFTSPPRGRTMDDIAVDKRSQGVPSYPTHPNYAVWTAKGMRIGKGERRIEAERWGKNLREPRAVLPQPAQEPPEPSITNTSQPATCAQYVHDPGSPTYKVAFNSGLPRIMAAPASGKHSDTRLRCKTYDALTCTPSALGPGSFQTDLPRFKSWNVAFQGAPDYMPQGTSLATMPGSPQGKLKATPSAAGRLQSAHSSGATSWAGTQRSGSRQQCSSPSRCGTASTPGAGLSVTPGRAVPLLTPSLTAGTPLTGCTSSLAELFASPFKDADAAAAVNAEGLTPRGAAGGDEAAVQWPSPGDAQAGDAGGTDDLAAEVLEALDADWAVHAAAVADTYARTDELRGAATLAARQYGASIPTTPVTLTLPAHLTSSPAATAGGMDQQGSRSPSPQACSSPTRSQHSSGLPFHHSSTSLWGSPIHARPSSKLSVLVGSGLDGSCSHSPDAGMVEASPTGGAVSQSSSGGLLSPSQAAPHLVLTPTSLFPSPSQVATLVSPRSIAGALELTAKLPGDDTLTFMRRNVPHRTQVTTQLKAIADVRSARREAHHQDHGL